jgi:hypothetical protein
MSRYWPVPAEHSCPIMRVISRDTLHLLGDGRYDRAVTDTRPGARSRQGYYLAYCQLGNLNDATLVPA